MSLLLLVACSSSPEPSATTTTTIVAAPTGAPEGLVLREVGFDPAFVEIANTSGAAAAGLVLEVDGATVDAGSAAAGETIVVGDVTFGVGPGELVLRDASGRALDRATWPLAVGDFVPDSVDVIGRAPGMDDPFSFGAWVAYPAASATPGAPNLVPGVEVLLPLDGVILTGAEATLAWYPVPGAVSYRVEVATDDAFASLVLDSSASDAALATGPLAPGHYVWRLRSVGSDGRESAVSEVSGFELRAAGDRAPPPVGKKLSVPYVTQHKDTAMLLLEEPHESMPMAWDQPHPIPNPKDPADNMNSALAMIAITNHFYGGDLSQDRIGYEKLKGRRPGPEEDLMYGYGLDSDKTTEAFEWALNGPVDYIPSFNSLGDAWALITAAIDVGTPVPGAGPKHGYVITGYQVEANGHRIIVVNDPANGRGLRLDLDNGKANAKTLSLWRLQGTYVGRKQEKSVTTDADKDEVVDFDETERFKTNPNDQDTDGDKLKDKKDVITGVFDPEHGYAIHPDHGGRDWDGDQVPTELDPDSDEGGCKDGEEDTNQQRPQERQGDVELRRHRRRGAVLSDRPGPGGVRRRHVGDLRVHRPRRGRLQRRVGHATSSRTTSPTRSTSTCTCTRRTVSGSTTSRPSRCRARRSSSRSRSPRASTARSRRRRHSPAAAPPTSGSVTSTDGTAALAAPGSRRRAADDDQCQGLVHRPRRHEEVVRHLPDGPGRLDRGHCRHRLPARLARRIHGTYDEKSHVRRPVVHRPLRVRVRPS